MKSGFRLGACDYPEHVPRETWLNHPRQQIEAGLTHIRLAEFAWQQLEPSRNAFRFAWLDEAIDALHAAGLEVLMCTPTATPPAWLSRERPEILFVDAEGRRRTHGGRRHYDYSSPAYWDEARRITSIVAERYGNHPAVIGWQTDNEHGCHGTTRSYSDCARSAFRVWLEARYGSVQALNDAWGTAFWSQAYGSFQEVELPNLTVYKPNPSQVLDFNRFSSDRVAAFDRMQTEIIRAHSPGRFVTHNFMPLMPDYDHYRAAEHLDFPSLDLYPLGNLDFHHSPEEKRRYANVGHPDLCGLAHDLQRGLKPDPSLGPWIMEQQCGQVDWARVNALPAAGAVRLWALNAFAHGVDRVTYFRWRAANAAQELMHSGLLRHDGTPDRGLEEVAAMRSELEALSLEPVRCQVALLHDYESLWLYDLQPHHADLSYWKQVLMFYTGLRELGVDVDVVHPSRDLGGYALVVAPALTLMSAETAERLEGFARGGGQVLLGPRSAFRDPRGQVYSDPDTHPLKRLAGVRVSNFDALEHGLGRQVTTAQGPHALEHWAESLEPCEADVTVTARYAQGPLDGRNAVTRHQLGRGAVVYQGALGATLTKATLETALEAAGVQTLRLPPDVRVSRRGSYTVTQNWGANNVDLSGIIGNETGDELRTCGVIITTGKAIRS